MPRGRPKKTIKTIQSASAYLDKVSQEVQNNQSKLSMVLGGLIILVIGILVFNYFNKNRADLGPAQNTNIEDQQKEIDVTPDKLPGKYTVRESDTLFTIAEKYYQDGSKFEEIAKANNLADVNSIVAGQVLEIPKLAENPTPTPSVAPTEPPTPTPSINPEPSPTASATPNESPQPPSSQSESSNLGTGGANTTTWGTRIEGNAYTVQEGDWLSTIAGRAYGDIYAYQKIADANHIVNPDLILPGMVLTIPR